MTHAVDAAAPPLVLETFPLGPASSVAPWPTLDPFLLCVHHRDTYPRGDGTLGPAASLAGRALGHDFAGIDGWRMYHGHKVPGFPQHPHRGFETVTITREGHLDHSDSLGAAARYGQGDVQWLTAGDGVVHAEMFPLLSETEPNPNELFQLWLNLPRASKRARPHFSMFWAEDVPRLTLEDAQGRRSEVVVVAGRFGTATPLAPPPESYASHPEADVAIWTLKLEPHAELTLPPSPAAEDFARVLYFFRGSSLQLRSLRSGAAERLAPRHGAVVLAQQELVLTAGAEPVEVLVLQGRPLREPVAAHGPFVMNTREELRQTIVEYQRTRFGGWPWGDDAPVHPVGSGRFARYPDGREERPLR